MKKIEKCSLILYMSVSISIDRSKSNKKYHFSSGTYTIQQNGVNTGGALDYIDESELYGVLDLSLQDHPKLVQAIVNDNREEIINYLLENGLDDAFTNSHIVLNLVVNKESLESMITNLNNGDPMTILQNPVKVIQLIKKYHLGQLTRSVPYTNYDTNDGIDNCVVRYAMNTYPGISPNKIRLFFSKECTIDTVIKFILKYDIPARITNIRGTIIYDRTATRRKYAIFQAMIADHHLYPLNKGKAITVTHQPKLSQATVNTSPDNAIKYIENHTVYVKEGMVYDDNRILLDECDKRLYRSVPHNFTYKGSPKCLALYLPNNTISEAYAYDIKCCYSSLFFEVIPTDFKYGAWTCFDLWLPYDGSPIRSESYYLLSDRDLTRFGIVTNFHIGFFVQLLLDHKVIKSKDIVSYNKPYYIESFSKVRDKTLKYLTDCATRDKVLDPKLLSEYKRLRVYNGVLGRTRYSKCKRFTPLPVDDVHLINLEYNGLSNEDKEITGAWQYHPIDEHNGQVVKNQTHYRNINHVNLYNLIIEYANFVILSKILSVKDQPIAIKTDCVFYEHRQPEYENDNRFRIEKEYHIPFYIIKRQQHDADAINTSIYKQFEHCKNITYYGPPGTGKTYIVKHNEKYDACATVSNMCRLNMRSDDNKIEPKTLFSLFNMFNPHMWIKTLFRLKGRTLWIDEFSMCGRQIWNFIAIATSQYNTRLILSGDINQIPPPLESKIDLDNPVVRLLFGLQTELKTDYRNSPNLIRLRESVLTMENIDLYKLLITKYDRTDNWLKLDRHLTWSNNLKHRINASILQERGYKWEYILDDKQTYYIDTCPGVIIIAIHTCNNLGIAKSDLWRVSSVGKYDIILNSISRDESLTLSRYIIAAYFILGFCTTIHASQGLTIADKFAIHNVGSIIPKENRSILYTAITRGKDADDIALLSANDKYTVEPLVYPKIKVIKCDEDAFEDLQLTINK